MEVLLRNVGCIEIVVKIGFCEYFDLYILALSLLPILVKVECAI